MQNSFSHEGTPSGFKLLDTRTWRTTTLDAEADWFLQSGSALLTLKGSTDGELTTYSLDGRRMLDAHFDQPFGSADVLGGYLYDWNAKTMRVVDLSDGSIVARLPMEDYVELIGDRDAIER